MWASQVQPYMAGVSSMWLRLAPKVKAAANPLEAITSETTDARTGTDEAPLPARRPCTAPIQITGRSQSQRGDQTDPFGLIGWRARQPRGRAASRVVRQAGQAAKAAVRTTIATPPNPRTTVFTATPGSGSATRAVPRGKMGGRATAVATARPAAARPMTHVRASSTRASWRWVAPSASAVA